VQAHTSGEVGILGTVLLRVYSGTTLAIFIEIGLYLTEKGQKISWHSFFETRCSRLDSDSNDGIGDELDETEEDYLITLPAN